MVNDFELLVQSHPTLPSGVAMGFYRNYGDSAVLDVEGETRRGRIAVWESGAVDLEIQEIASGRQIFYHNAPYCAWQDVFPEVRAFLNALKSR